MLDASLMVYGSRLMPHCQGTLASHEHCAMGHEPFAIKYASSIMLSSYQTIKLSGVSYEIIRLFIRGSTFECLVKPDSPKNSLYVSVLYL